MATANREGISHPLPRPIVCPCCGSPKVHIQKRGFMGLRVYSEWDLIWHCGDCDAMVGCHKGTDVPLGIMANASTREARYLAHKAFDRLWRGGPMHRDEAYRWMAHALGIAYEDAHIGRLNEEQCNELMAAIKKLDTKPKRHWSQDKRKKRNK